MKPMLPVFEACAAIEPTRKEPCSSANTRLATLADFDSEASSTIAKLISGYSGATLPSATRVGEADRDDRVVAALGELDEALLAGGVGLTCRGGRQLLEGQAVDLGDAEVEARRGGVVERLVTTAADVVGDADLDGRRRAGRAGGGPYRCCRHHCCHRQRA